MVDLRILGQRRARVPNVGDRHRRARVRRARKCMASQPPASPRQSLNRCRKNRSGPFKKSAVTRKCSVSR
jgi:hypothetical protein